MWKRFVQDGNAAASALRYSIAVNDGALNIALTEPDIAGGEPAGGDMNPKMSGISVRRTGDAPGGSTFVRGDANSDGSINLTDGVIPLLYLFSGGAPPACADSADTNDSGNIEITDAIIIFSWLFTGGVAPEEPSPLSPGYTKAESGEDLTEDDIGCENPSPVCP